LERSETKQNQETQQSKKMKIHNSLTTAFSLVGGLAALGKQVQGAIVEYTVVIEGAWVNVSDANGVDLSRQGSLINGTLPGPTLTATEGDTVIIRVINKNTSEAAMHWHGMHLPGAPFMDGPVGVANCGIPANSEEIIEFTATPAGTHWYHSHSAIPYTEGQYAPLIVYPREHTQEWEGMVDEEFIVLMHEWGEVSTMEELAVLTGGAETSMGTSAGMEGTSTGMEGTGAPTEGMEGMGTSKQGMEGMEAGTGAMAGMDAPGIYGGVMESDVVWPTMMINGKSNGTEFAVEPGKTYRFRLIHGGASYSVNVSVASPLQMELVMVDPGTYLQPSIVDYIGVEIGARYDFLITPPDSIAPGAYPIYITDYSGLNMASPGSIVVKSQATDGNAAVTHSTGPVTVGRTNSAFYPLPAASNSMLPVATRQINLTLTGTEVPYAWGINNKFAKYPDVPVYISGMEPGQVEVVNVEVNEVVDILLDNSNGMMTHPMHLHGHSFYVLGDPRTTSAMGAMRGRRHLQLTSNPVLRDTVNVGPGAMVMIRLVANNPGPWMMHCHLELHLLVGMSLVFMVGTPDDWPVPNENQEIRVCGSKEEIDALQQNPWSQQFLVGNLSNSTGDSESEMAGMQEVQVSSLAVSSGSSVSMPFILLSHLGLLAMYLIV
jgi:multicopper oxidase